MNVVFVGYNFQVIWSADLAGKWSASLKEPIIHLSTNVIMYTNLQTSLDITGVKLGVTIFINGSCLCLIIININ